MLCWRNQTQGIRDKTTGVYYSNPYVMKGCSDIIAVINGQFIGVEVKTATGKQSADQILFQRRLENAGGKYIVARSVVDIKDILLCG